MPNLSRTYLAEYLQRLLGKPVSVLAVEEHGKENQGDLKAFGYGTPVFITFECDGKSRQVVLETLSPSPFGHDHFADRAQTVLWEHSSFNNLPRHVRSLDCGAFLPSGELLSTGRAEEFFILTEFVEGTGYFRDLERIGRTGDATDGDIARSVSLADYLADIHSTKRDDPPLYRRRFRDLLGHGECIMGLIDNYPDRFEFIDQSLLKKIELLCVDWRWRSRRWEQRLCQVHGDFHPWNILFRSGLDFAVLDRSRGEWGEAADDVSCLSVNYLFSALIRNGRLSGPFEKLFLAFWERYLEQSGDSAVLEIAPVFYAWRGLVIGSPLWYPHLPTGVRRLIFAFIENVLAADRFDYTSVNRYIE